MSPVQTNVWIPQPLRKLGGRMLGHGLNRLLKLDPDTQAALAPLQGRRIGVHLRGPELAFDIAVRDGALCVEPPHDADSKTEANQKPDLRLATTPGALLTLAIPRDGGALPPGKVEIAGDAELARRLEKLAHDFAPDVEAAFARSFGEVAGVAIARALRDAKDWIRTSAQHAVTDGVDWLRDDARLVIPRAEMNDFLDEVDALRERVERLAARMKRLPERAA